MALRYIFFLILTLGAGRALAYDDLMNSEMNYDRSSRLNKSASQGSFIIYGPQSAARREHYYYDERNYSFPYNDRRPYYRNEDRPTRRLRYWRR